MSNNAIPLSRIADVKSGHSFRKSLADESAGNVRVVAMAQGDDDVLTTDVALPCINFEGNIPKLQLQAGDVLFRPRGVSTQAIYVASIERPCIFAAPLVRLRVNEPQQLDSWYLHWALNSPQVQRDINAQARGTMIRMVSLQSLQDIAIPVPPIQVQRQIVEVARLRRKERALSTQLVEATQRYAEQVLWAAAQEVR